MKLSNMAPALDNLLAAVQRNPDGTVTLRFVECVGGALLVNTQLPGLMHIREEDALGATAVTFEWPAPGITAVEITALSEAAPDGFSSIVLCIDPPTDVLRDAWLTAGDNLTMDAQRLQLRANGEPMLIQFTAPVTKIGIKRDTGADALRVTAVGVGATA